MLLFRFTVELLGLIPSIDMKIRDDHCFVLNQQIPSLLPGSLFAKQCVKCPSQFEYREFSQHTSEELGLKLGVNKHQESMRCWSLGYSEDDLFDSYLISRLCGKRLIAPLPKEKSGVCGIVKEGGEKYMG